MLRPLASLLAALLATACSDPPPAPLPAPAPAPAAKPQTPLPPAKLTPPAPGADDPRCGAAVVYLNAVRGATDLAALRSAYDKTALRTLVQASDAATKRDDDTTISTLLASTDPTAAVAVQYAIHGALAQWMRQNLKVAAEDKDRGKRGEAWAAARCVWAQDLRHLGLALQTRSLELSSETARDDTGAVEVIDAAFTDPTAAVAVQYAIHGALAQWMRQNLKVAAEDKDRGKRGEAWAAARCVWAQDLRHLGLALQTRSLELSSETARDDTGAVEVIDAAFTVGNVAVTADPVDERNLLPARQVVEKTWYRVVHRELADAATRARDGKDPIAARRALGLFDMLRDRLADKNSPGVAIVTAALTGDPAAIDPAAILREIDVALAKRTRKYCSDALDAKLLGTPLGTASAQEGATYARVLLPGMRARLADQKFDAEAHMANWSAFVEAVDVGVDADEIKRLSDDLVHWNCAYQQALGVRECTATADELAKKP